MPLKIVSVNVNGVRAAFRNGMPAWLDEAKPDILALQEVRAETEDLVRLFNEYEAERGGEQWHILHDNATAKGRAGVAVLSKLKPEAHRTELGPKSFDSAGRWLEVDFKIGKQTITVISTYVHSGEVGTPKQDEKYKFLEAMQKRMKQLIDTGGHVVVLGDLNVGHTELDIKNWKGNLKNAGFLPEERAYFDTLMNKQGWVDVGRAAHPGVDGPYTWWSFRGQAFDTDAGWRIDYQLATPKLAEKGQNYRVDRAPSYDTRWTDHSPVNVEYDL
jgi:exodeoxyribonuclease-3